MKAKLLSFFVIFVVLVPCLMLILVLTGSFNAPSRLGKGTGVQCSWIADDPTCDADCSPVCQPPVCEFEECPGRTPNCWVRCTDSPAMDSCPICETVCNADLSCGSPLCEAVSCNWECKKPTNCAKPTFELQCELPECSV
jgi:hypothetical protein